MSGVIEVGITASINPSLPSDSRLPILQNRTLNIAAGYAGAWAYSKYKYSGDAGRHLAASCAIAAVAAGLCRRYNGVEDGDWRAVTTLDPNVRQNCPDDCFSKESLKRALTLMIATKANFWAHNHHTGQGQVIGFAKEALEKAYPGAVTAQLVSVLNDAANRISTRFILTIAGVAGILETEEPIYPAISVISISSDVKLQFSVLPAGTQKARIAFEAAQRLMRSVFPRICPDVQSFVKIPSVIDAINKNRAGYHVGARYLTGQNRLAYNDEDMDCYLGRLGCFMINMFEHSALAKSPYFTREKVESYPDYSPAFNTALQEYCMTSVISSVALQDLITQQALFSEAEIADIVQKFQKELSNITDVTRKFQKELYDIHVSSKPIYRTKKIVNFKQID